jgi:acyl-CoA synthetase (NDP forming)
VSDPRLGAFFTPRSVAVYGASRQEGKLGHTLLRNVVDGGFDGEVIPVNPAAGTILGRAAVPSLAERGATELALISVPAERAAAAVADAARAGCRAAVVLSSGFGETGAAGQARERELTAAAGGMRLVGPNCMGVLSHLGGQAWLNGTYFWNVPRVPGSLSFLSQSGAFGGMFFDQLRRRGRGLARFVSLGNAADVNETDLLGWLGDDPATGAVGMFIEGIRDGRRFVHEARAVTTRKPVIALKAGKYGTGARAAASHTGSLAGRHGAAQAAFARAGVIEAEDSDTFFDALAAIGERGAAGGRRVAVLTISGGPGVLAADAAEQAGLALPPPSPAVAERLRGLAPDFAALGNPIDLTPQCPPDHFPDAIAAVFADPAFDGLIVINCGLDLPPFAEGVLAGAAATGKPVAAYLLDVPQIERRIDEARIPRFGSPERAVRAYAATVIR